jgi:N6-adenosine-specific RNA methylase IME4
VKYRTIVADPPWNVMAGPLRGGVPWKFGPPSNFGPSEKLDYPSMSVDEIAALPVAREAADTNCALYLWTINAYVEAAYQVARAWGFKPSTLLVWAKNPMGGGLGGAFGITTEYCLYARKGSPTERRTTGTWFNWKRHYVNGKPSHSSKPDAFFDLVQQVSEGPFLELFARRERMFWDSWGNESANTASLESA